MTLSRRNVTCNCSNMDNMEESFVSEVVDESPPSYIFYLDEESGGEDVEEDASETEHFGVEGIQPYMFEPLPRNAVSITPAEETDVHPREHWDVTQWCSCDNCVNVPSGPEKVCCKEVDQIIKKCEEAMLVGLEMLNCITKHAGFPNVCLDPWVLQTEYANIVQYHYDKDQGNFSENERWRHTAYRIFVKWCWGYLGARYRVAIPACVIRAIRAAFPAPSDEGYTGFQLPPIHPTFRRNRT
ncbi:uncharacterized protein LOC134448231 isoform X2 [Engraulis encrasicolus]|uniref:uncharacterized protein LOC134448231 isoform X2 n=1 Tax=Engraulis encrasicolus TaxID=184585 RepID=UPI002FCEFA60